MVLTISKLGCVVGLVAILLDNITWFGKEGETGVVARTERRARNRTPRTRSLEHPNPLVLVIDPILPGR